MYCSVIDGQVRVLLDEGEMLCTQYGTDITEAIKRLE